MATPLPYLLKSPQWDKIAALWAATDRIIRTVLDDNVRTRFILYKMDPKTKPSALAKIDSLIVWSDAVWAEYNRVKADILDDKFESPDYPLSPCSAADVFADLAS
jgi:hypothetical protein